MAVETSSGMGRLDARELDARLRRGERLAILDVRRREAWTADPARIPGATWVPLEEVPRRTREIPRETHLVVYCD